MADTYLYAGAAAHNDIILQQTGAPSRGGIAGVLERVAGLP